MTNLASKVKDLDKLLNEYEFNFNSFKLKQQSLEKRIEILEKEFSKLGNIKPFQNKTNIKPSTSITHINSQKLIAIEQSHKILEKELQLLKDVQLTDLESIKENIDVLQTQIFGEISNSISQTSLKDIGSVEYLQKQCAEIQERLNHLRKRKKDSSDMQKNYGELKLEMRQQFNNLVEERRAFEIEKNSLTKDFEKLTENAGIQLKDNQSINMITTNNTNDIFNSMITSQNEDILMNNSLIQESIIELEQKADEWEQKYKNELDTFNIMSQQQEQQIKQLKEQILAAKLNNEAKNLDLTNQLKLLNSYDEYIIDTTINTSNEDVLLINKTDINIINKNASLTRDKLDNISKYSSSSINNLLETNDKLKTTDFIETNTQLTNCKKSNLTESILELEGKLNEWGLKYNKEIDSFNKQQKEQILLNKKEETQIKLLKEQITAAKLVNESSNEDDVMHSFLNTSTTINTNTTSNDATNKSSRNIKESILNLEAKFNQLEHIYNTESLLLDNKLKTLSTNNLSTSNSNLSNLKLTLNEAYITSSTCNNLDEIRSLQSKSVLSCHSFKSETELIKITKSNSAECILVLEAKVHEWEKKHQRELEIFNVLSQQQETQIKDLKEKLTSEALQVETLNSDYSMLQAEANRLEILLRQKCESLEFELNETNKLNDYECELAMKNKNYNQMYENYDKEIKSLIEQISHLQKGLKIKEEEFENLEKLIEIERLKTSSLVKQIEDLNCINIQLNMQNNEAKSRLVTLDLLTDECIQLRKNLTFIKLKA